MSAIASIVVKVMFYIAEVIFWLFIVKGLEKAFKMLKNVRLPRLHSVKA